MRNWDWSDAFVASCFALTFALISLGGYAAFQDHTVQFYFMSDHGSGVGRNGYCIDGYRNWYANDTGVFCSDDIQKTLNILKEMNDGLAARKAGR